MSIAYIFKSSMAAILSLADGHKSIVHICGGLISYSKFEVDWSNCSLRYQVHKMDRGTEDWHVYILVPKLVLWRMKIPQSK